MSKGNWHEFDNHVSKAIKDSSASNQSTTGQNIRIQRTKAGKRGKTVTVISGFELENTKFRLLLKSLKARCGTGGTLKENSIELQGDQVQAAMDFLTKEGYVLKRSGG